MARAVAPFFGFDLRIDHRSKWLQHRTEARRIFFEHRERVLNRLDGRHALEARLAPNAILARLRRREGIPRQSRERWIYANELLRERPRPVDDYQCHRPCWRIRREIAGARPRPKQDGGPRRIAERGNDLRIVFDLDSDHQLRIRQAERRHSGGADRDALLSWMLNDDDPRLGIDRGEMTAPAHRDGACASRTLGARVT